ncbi:MAG: hypothetical protein A3E85_03540 [Gammaproteobacteria bacterium RIFCSPHIGHO2_12_FULL_45_12]|nr:MAG: hypothetical protein A3E85_03540 [Gammaproteobacteria bacterium RIFCSPHIGHO2_12_FULL_45_12]
MTENLLQKLEEKMMMLLSEVETLRKDLRMVLEVNASLKAERETHAKKLQDLLSLLDEVVVTEQVASKADLSLVRAEYAS